MAGEAHDALALHYGMTEQGNLYAGSIAVDNIITTLWMVVTIGVPRLLGRQAAESAGKDDALLSERSGEPSEDSGSVNPLSLALLLAAGLGAIVLSDGLARAAAAWGPAIPSVLILTTIALALAQIPAVSKAEAIRPLGMFSVYLFLAVIGAYCDLSALGRIGSLGASLLTFALLVVAGHGLIIFGLGRLVTRDWGILAVASQANIGGAPSALALARSLRRNDLLLPAVLVGSLGYAVGTYLGFLAAEYVLG